MGLQEVGAFLAWTTAHLEEQGPDFRRVFAPALAGLACLVVAAQGHGHRAPPFVGWRQDTHWPMPGVLAAR